MIEKVIRYIEENNLIKAGEAVVAGVSGGADSMCLLHILGQIKYRYNLKIIVVHVHHGIRKETADRDADFVKTYCESHDTEFRLYKYNIPAISKELGMTEEEAGRYARYKAFYTELEKCQNGKIAVAHQREDVAETVLMNIFRGTGINGVTGIKPMREKIIRPLLCLTRKDVETYLKQNNLSYVNDETNFDDTYTRNKIRLKLIPYIKNEINSGAVEHICNMAEQLSEIKDFTDSAGEEKYNECVRQKEDGLRIDVKKYMSYHRVIKTYIIRRAVEKMAGKIKDIGKCHVDAVDELFTKQVGKKVNLPYSLTAERSYESVVLFKNKKENKALANESQNFEVYIKDVGKFDFSASGKNYSVEVCKDVKNDNIFTEQNYTKWIDYDILKGNLCLRYRKPGDYISVRSDGSGKKLKDYFIDLKVPKEERDRVLLLADGNQIIWVYGYRLSEAYKIKENTKNILKITIRER